MHFYRPGVNFLHQGLSLHLRFQTAHVYAAYSCVCVAGLNQAELTCMSLQHILVFTQDLVLLLRWKRWCTFYFRLPVFFCIGDEVLSALSDLLFSCTILPAMYFCEWVPQVPVYKEVPPSRKHSTHKISTGTTYQASDVAKHLRL